MVPNNSAACLLIFKIFSLPTWLIWTFTVIKFQIMCLPTCLLSTTYFTFTSYFHAFQLVFITVTSKWHQFYISLFIISVQFEKIDKELQKNAYMLITFLQISYLHGYQIPKKFPANTRDVTTGATGATEVAPKFSDTLTLSQPREADSAHHCRGRS